MIVAGWLLGAAVGMLSPIVGRVLARICDGLGGTAWAVGQISGAGLFAGPMGLLAVVGMSTEAGHAQVVRNVDIVELSSLADWQPGGPVLAAQVEYLEHLHPRALRSSGSVPAQARCSVGRLTANHYRPSSPRFSRRSCRACPNCGNL